MTIARTEPTRTIDVTGEICPMTSVPREAGALEAMRPGDVLDVLLRGAEALENVPNLAGAGHAVLSIEPQAADRHRNQAATRMISRTATKRGTETAPLEGEAFDALTLRRRWPIA